MSQSRRVTRGSRPRVAVLWGLALGFAVVGTTRASSPQAWAGFEQEVIDACLAASSLSHARPAGARVDFDDALGYSVLLLSGSYPQPHMKHKPGRELCLFDRRSRRAAVTVADGLVSP